MTHFVSTLWDGWGLYCGHVIFYYVQSLKKMDQIRTPKLHVPWMHRLHKGFTSRLIVPDLYIRANLVKPGRRREMGPSVRRVLRVTKTTVSPISSIVTFCSSTLKGSATWERSVLSLWLKHRQLSGPCVELTSSFLSEVISSVDGLHKHRTNI